MIRIRPLEKRHAKTVAALHHHGIPTGFLSSLGARFLRQMYAAVPSAPTGFGYVQERADGQVLGFVACAVSTGRFYKQALLRRGVLMAGAMFPRCLRPSVMKRLWETLRYPAEVGHDGLDLPAAEILSIVVDEGVRGMGIGTALIGAALDEFRRRGISRAKVAVGAGNEPANCFYRRCGFRLALTREHHGLPMNVYVHDLWTSLRRVNR
jgi:ribosomal protein S18 acetylase RimI-like enzyme